MKNMIKLLSLVLAVVMVLGMFAACGDDKGKDDEESKGGDTTTANGGDTTNSGPQDSEPEKDYNYVAPEYDDEYEIKSAEIYAEILGEFYEAYARAKDAKTVSERYALMAVAEAKLLEAGVMLPLSSNGGMYAMSRVAPYSVDYALWGNDSYRYHQALVAKTFIKPADRNEMKAKWNELKGTGTYADWAKTFLASKGYELKNTYTIGYSSDPLTWDVLNTSRAADSEAIINTYDGLVEYDVEGNLKGALAESWTVSEDGLKYTFKLRKGVMWVDSQGRDVAEVKADDFVAGMQHMMDSMAGLEYLVAGIIVNASEYIDGDITDFAQVGVKAVDDYTVEYTLCQPTSYFMTMLGYGVFAPMNRSYYVSKGGVFGADFDPAAENYTYGKTPNDIAYCGPYLVTTLTASNTIVFSANAKYWNKDNINIKTITWLYNDGKDPLKAYNDAVAGTIDGCSLTEASLTKAKEDGNFDAYSYISSTDATSFCAFYNINRIATHNFNDENVGKTQHTTEGMERTKTALQNVHFRRALSFATDRGAYNAQVTGEDLKLNSLRNTYTPGNFVVLTEATTIQINGTDKTYPAGTYYGQIMQDQINADGVKIKVWDPTAEEGAGSSDGFDGWYNVENAKEELAKAIEELASEGITIDASNPIKVELPYFSGYQVYANRAQSYKQSIEAALDGKVEVVLIELNDIYDWYYAGYYANNGSEGNYDVYDVSGWGPDYGDPATYLDTFLPDYNGYMAMLLGIF